MEEFSASNIVLPSVVDPLSGEVLLTGTISLGAAAPEPAQLDALLVQLAAVRELAATLRGVASRIRDAVALWHPAGCVTPGHKVAVEPRISAQVASRLLASRWAAGVTARQTTSYRLSTPVFRAAVSNVDTKAEILELLAGCTWEVTPVPTGKADEQVDDDV